MRRGVRPISSSHSRRARAPAASPGFERPGRQFPDPSADGVADTGGSGSLRRRDRLRDQHDRSAMADDVERARRARSAADAIALDPEHAALERHGDRRSGERARCHRELVRRPCAGWPSSVGQVGRQRRLERQPRARRRVRERQPRRVQERPLEPRERRQLRRQPLADAAVERVAGHRVAGFAQVHANLMRAAGARSSRERATRRASGSTLEDVRRRPCAARARAARHLLAVPRIAADRRVRSSAPACGVPHTSATYSLLDFAIVKLPRERAMRAIVLARSPSRPTCRDRADARCPAARAPPMPLRPPT